MNPASTPSGLGRLLSWLRSILSIPGDREALESYLNQATDVHDLESRQRAWDQRRSISFFD